MLSLSCGARAQTRITLLSPDPLKKEVDAIVQSFEMKTGYKVQESYGTGVSSRKTVGEGGALDVTLLFAPFDDALKTGNVDKSTQTVVARVRLALAVKEGRPSPDISNAAAVKKLLLNAKSIGTGRSPLREASAEAAMLAFEKMGITDRVEARTEIVPNWRRTAESHPRRQSEVAVGPYLSDYRNPDPGLNLAGALPPDAATPVDITGWIATNAPDKKAAMPLLGLLQIEGERPLLGKQPRYFPVPRRSSPLRNQQATTRGLDHLSLTRALAFVRRA